MDQNQTPVPQPDYDFIVNQPGPNGELPGQLRPQKRNTKLVILIVLVVLTLIIVAVAIFLPNKNNQGNNGLNSNASGQEVVQTYLNKVEGLDLDGAYELLNPDSRVSKQTFVDVIAPALLLSVFLDRCTVQEAKGDQVAVQCSESDTSTVTTMIFKITNTKPPYIDQYGIAEVTE